MTCGAQDARLDFGGITVTRLSNTIDDLEDGLSLDLREAGTGRVTVTTGRDVDAAVEQVGEVVERVNEAVSTLQGLTAYDPESGESGPARRYDGPADHDDVRQSVAGIATPDGADGFRLASDVGIELGRGRHAEGETLGGRHGAARLDAGDLEGALGDLGERGELGEPSGPAWPTARASSRLLNGA